MQMQRIYKAEALLQPPKTKDVNFLNVLGTKRRVDATNIIQNTQMNVDISTATTPLYYHGFEALSSEISVLESRKSDDPFISGLRDLQEELALLRSIAFDKKKYTSNTYQSSCFSTQIRN
tara:strand:- start:238 stop:597 length:360 start_codon:yes stop_codon:yes gene_type:complete